MKYSHYDSKPHTNPTSSSVAPTKFTWAFAWASPPKSKLAAPYESSPTRDLRIVPRDLRIVPRSLRFVAVVGKFSMLSDGPKGEGARSARLCPLAESWRELERKIRNQAQCTLVHAKQR